MLFNLYNVRAMKNAEENNTVIDTANIVCSFLYVLPMHEIQN